MDVSILLARLIGPLYLAVGIGMLVNQGYYREMMRNLPTGGIFFYLSGFLAMSFGLAILQFHNLWVADWRVIFTLLGWLGLAKGVLLLVWPQAVAQLSMWFAGGPMLVGSGLFATLLGAWFCYLGYLA